MNSQTAAVGLLIAIALSGCSTTGVTAPSGGQAEVIQKVQDMFDAMEARDTAALRTILVPEVTFFSIDERQVNAPPRVVSLDAFVESIGTSPHIIKERIHNPVVQLDGGIASLWAPYSLHRGTTLSHCGHDAFILVRREKRWWITAVSYTLRPANECERT